MPSTHNYGEIFNLSSVESNYEANTRTIHPNNATTLSTDISLYNHTNRTDVYFKISGKCHDWQDAQHALFQLANLCMVVSFLTPSSFRHHMFFLRCMMSFGFVFFVLWAGFFICMPDVLAWNGASFLINLGFIIYLGYHVLPARYNKDLEDLYTKVFKPLKITPQEFRDLSEIGDIDILTKGSIYAKEKITNSGEKISILLKGRLKVTYERLFLHHIDINHFVDSPEYDSHTEDREDDKYQISIVAVDDSLLLTWPYKELREYLEHSETVAPIFNQLIGKDVSNKLYQIQELLLSNPFYMLPLSSRQSSMVNLRTSLMNQNSSGNNTKFNSFGLDMKNCTVLPPLITWAGSLVSNLPNFPVSVFTNLTLAHTEGRIQLISYTSQSCPTMFRGLMDRIVKSIELKEASTASKLNLLAPEAFSHLADYLPVADLTLPLESPIGIFAAETFETRV